MEMKGRPRPEAAATCRIAEERRPRPRARKRPRSAMGLTGAATAAFFLWRAGGTNAAPASSVVGGKAGDEPLQHSPLSEAEKRELDRWEAPTTRSVDLHERSPNSPSAREQWRQPHHQRRLRTRQQGHRHAHKEEDGHHRSLQAGPGINPHTGRPFPIHAPSAGSPMGGMGPGSTGTGGSPLGGTGPGSSTSRPFLPSYADGTCLNDREPQKWETNGKATLQECCIEFFGWAKEGCPTKYGELMAERMDDPNYGKEEEKGEDDCGCGPWDWGCKEECKWKHCGCLAHEWECLDECKAKKEQELADARPEVNHPYLPNPKEGTCLNNREAKPWDERTYASLKKCCGQEFRHDMKECVRKGTMVEHAKETDVYYFANWGLRSCEERERDGKGRGYLTLEQCCEDNFDWVSDECLGVPPTDGGGHDFWDTYDPHAVGHDDEDAPGVPKEYPEMWWHPLWSAGHCTTTREQAPPTWMANDPKGTMWKTYRECCEANFPDTWGSELQACYDESGPLAGPTRPPSSEATAIQGTDLAYYYWPVYAESRCELDGNDAPRSFRRDALTYFALTAGECCREHFPTERKPCVLASPRLPGDDDGSRPVGGSGNEEVNPNRYKYRYFPSFGKVACLTNAHMDAPLYMYDSPEDFFFHTVDACCSVGFEFEYQDCLENTRLIELDVPLADPYAEYDDGAPLEEREPSLLIRFAGKLYFRNVFLPHSSPEHMLTIRNAVLHAVKGALHRYKVATIEGNTFDGMDVSALEDVVDARRGLRVSSRRLDRMQLFTFSLALSHGCDQRCAADTSRAGRSISLDATYDFDDAVVDNAIFNAVVQDMEGMGMPGPFSSADMPEGYLQYEGVEWDGRYTHPPTISPEPTREPTGAANAPEPAHQEVQNPFYPDHTVGTCRNDGMQSEFMSDLFDTLEECCNFPWLEYYTCMILSEPIAPPTRHPTSPPTTGQPTTPWPTREPSPKPTRRPTPKPAPADVDFDSEWPTFSPTPQPSDAPTTAPPSESPTESPTKGPCMWHMNIDTGDGCIDNDEVMDGWLHPSVRDTYMHLTARACCDAVFTVNNRPCKVYTTECGTQKAVVQDSNAGNGNVGCGIDGWHVNIETNSGCTNSNNFPPAWLDPNLKGRMFHTSAESCCNEFFSADRACPHVDACASAPADDGPAPGPAPGPADNPNCPGHGWHINTATNAGCSNGHDNFNENWLKPSLKGRMFKASYDECCEEFFKGRPCPKDDQCGGAPPPAPAPAPEPIPQDPPADEPPVDEPPSPSCGEHGWHLHRINNDGCIDDNNYVEAWARSESMKEKMFLATRQACCDQFFSNRECKPYDSVCDVPGPAPTPAPEPAVPASPDVPSPATPSPVTPRPVEPVTVDSSEPFSQDFEVGSLSETEFATSDALPWTITDEFASTGSKSVTNAKTGRGESSELRLSLDLPKAVLFSFDVRHDVFAPLAALQVSVDGEQNVVAMISGHTGKPKFETQEVPLTKGAHEVMWRVFTMDAEMPPVTRGSGHVWVDNVQTREIVYVDFEDKEFDDALSFDGFGRWRIDDNMPSSNSELSAHSPKGLLPGEESTMAMELNSPPEGGNFSFLYHLGMGKCTFYVDGEEVFSLNRPGHGTNKFETDIPAGDHVFSWKYEPPPHANMPMSHLWVDSIMFA